MPSSFDNIIVGSGAGGSAAAYALANNGESVLLLERGPSLPKDGSTLSVDKVMRNHDFTSAESWQDKDGNPFTPNEFFNLGGKTKWYGAALLRFAEHEFAADRTHHCLSWPIRYTDLASYYDQAEQLLKVKTFALEPQLKKIARKITGVNGDWVAHALPLGLSDNIQQHQNEARHFDGFASVADLKSDAQNCFIRPIKDRPNFHCITSKQVKTFLPGKQSGRIQGVECTDGTQYIGNRIFLAAGALHSPRILQHYLQQQGLVMKLAGKNYKCHLNSALLALSPARKTDQLRKTLLLLNAQHPHSSIQTLGWLDGEILSTQLPDWIPAWLSNLLGSRAYGFWLTTEDGSDKRNRITNNELLSPPCLDYSLQRLPQTITEHQQLIRAFKRRLLRSGMLSSVRIMPMAATAHACGTLVTGDHEQHSVVDPNGKVWGFDNLYVVDGSVLPRSSKVNPALTIYAWALRTAELAMKEA
jgi:choline dehydrogenase-like flavoprotein